MSSAIVGLGGNVGGRDRVLERFRAAVAELREWPGVERVQCSQVWSTAPVGPVQSQPRFLNAAVRLQLIRPIVPHQLLAALLAIEARFGRDRSVRFGPRSIDLDLLLMDSQLVRDSGPPLTVVPHPRLAERAFALVPVMELVGAHAPLPGHHASVGVALEAALAAGQEPPKVVAVLEDDDQIRQDTQ